MGRSVPALFAKLSRGSQVRSSASERSTSSGGLVSLLSAVLSEVCGKDEEQLRGIILSIASSIPRVAGSRWRSVQYVECVYSGDVGRTHSDTERLGKAESHIAEGQGTP